MTSSLSLTQALAGQPRMRLAHLPTPLVRANRLSRELRADIWVKRDDLTGVTLTGNKIRKLEFIFGQAQRDRPVDTVVTVGAVQSNHARTTATAARVAGWDCHLVLGGDVPVRPTGNVLIANAVGAKLHFVGTQAWDVLESEAQTLCQELEADGRHPLFIPMGGSTGVGALGYVGAYLELVEQLAAAGVEADSIVHATSTGATQAGLDFAHRVLGQGPKVIGIGVAKTTEELTRDVTRLEDDLASLLGVDPGTASPTVLDRYKGPGYAVATHGGQAAFAQLARTEGILTDHVYTAKALNAVIDRAATTDGPVVFWHTGGVPSIFGDSAPASFWSPQTTRQQRVQPT